MIMAVVAVACVVCVHLVGCGSSRVALPPPIRPLIPTPDEAFRREPPTPGPSAPLQLPGVFRHRLDNGLTLLLVQRLGATTAAVRYVTRRGGEAGPTDLAGRAFLVGRLIERSLGDRREGVLPPLSLHAGVSVGYDSASLSVRSTTERLGDAIELAADAVRSPSFEPDRVDEERQAALEKMSWFGRSPERTALIRARGMLYGYDHRAAVPLWGSVESIRSVTRAELMALHHMSWGPRESALVVVADVAPSRLVALAEEAFGAWETERPPHGDDTPWIALNSPEVARALGLESSAPRSLVLLTEQGPPRTSRDYLPFRVLTMVLGGMSSARIGRTLREANVGCDEMRATYDARLAGGELVMAAEVDRRGNDLATTISDFVEELNRVIDEGPEPEEVVTARALVREQLRTDLEESDVTAATIAESFALGLGLEELIQLDEELGGITPHEVQAVARRWLRPDRAPIVVTGELNAVSFAFNVADVGQAVVHP